MCARVRSQERLPGFLLGLALLLGAAGAGELQWSPIGRLDAALDEAGKRGWTVVDMKRDWRVVFPFEVTVRGRPLALDVRAETLRIDDTAVWLGARVGVKLGSATAVPEGS